MAKRKVPVEKYTGGQSWYEGLDPRRGVVLEGPQIPESVIEKVMELLATGRPPSVACVSVGIDKHSVGKWTRRAHEAVARGDYDSHYIGWARRAEEAQALFHETLIDLLMQGAKRDPKLVLEVLRRRFPEYWSEPASQLEVRVGKMQDEEIETRIAELTTTLAAKGLLAHGEVIEDEEGKK